MAEVICFSILMVLVLANLAFTFWLAKHAVGAIRSSKKAMECLDVKTKILLDMINEGRSMASVEVSRHDCHIRRLAHKVGDETLVRILTPEPEDKEPVSLEEIAKSLSELSKTLDK